MNLEGIDIDAKKRSLIENLVSQAATKTPEEILPFFLAVNAKANELGISFTDRETALILDALKPQMSSGDIQKIDMIKSLAQMLKN